MAGRLDTAVQGNRSLADSITNQPYSSEKESSMNRINELIELLRRESVRSGRQGARRAGRCKLCGEPATEFRRAVSRIEYDISAICQKCQDRYFG
jgi:hypothetical protein